MAEPSTSQPSERRRAPNLGHPTYYFNRELSWLQFNERVLEEALDATKPLLERLKFLAIFSSNLDEFFMIRVSGLRRQLTGGVLHLPADGMTPAGQLAAIRERLVPTLERSARCWHDDLLPQLASHGIEVVPYGELRSKELRRLRTRFRDEIFPVLTPLAFDPAHPFPHISNLSVNLAVVIRRRDEEEQFARLKVPQILPRLLRVPPSRREGAKTAMGLGEEGRGRFVWLEEVVMANLDLLFPEVEIVSAHAFRVTRDADLEIEEDEASDLLEAMREVVGQRQFGSAVRLEVDDSMPERIRDILVGNLGLAPYQIYSSGTPLGLSDLMELTAQPRPDLKDAPFQPRVPPALASKDRTVFALLRRRNLLLYHPYDSFDPVVDFVRTSAQDPKVLAIKMALYRVGPNSPIVEALLEARENNKQVSVLVELKARFDEENNIVWARALEEAGVHVVYGLVGLKTHAKMCLVVRREPHGIVRYVHLGTGNYNPVTARVYGDLGYLTTDPDTADDVSDLFNALTGYSDKRTYRKLLVAPHGMRAQILDRIGREIESHRAHGGGHLAFKMNSLVDKASIRALYEASQAGVKVDLQTRSICCLRPGVERVSENIRVTSVVGRFLEHARIYYFRNGGNEEILIGSADLMPRNLDGRVETLTPVEGEALKRALRDDVLFLHLRDNVQCWEATPDGDWLRVAPAEGEPRIDSQRTLLESTPSWYGES